MTENCFDVLGIAPTKDEATIKKVYRKLLRQVNPEDDMQGFQRLRSAYEEACRYAKKQGTVREKSASEQFIERCRVLYQSFFQRICVEKWEELFEDPVCVNLDTEEIIRKAFLTFLMEHFHFPTEVWKCFDRTFAIRTDRKLLTEWFPENFVDFLQQAVREESVLNYSLFQEKEDVSGKDANKEDNRFDCYIDAYHQLRQATDLGSMDQARKELAIIKEIPVYHPYGELEEARILLYEGKNAQAGEIFTRLGKAYPLEERIGCCYGQYLQMEGRWEELRGIYDALLEEYPDSATVKSGKAEELLHAGLYREAREMILDLLEYNPQEERLLQDLMDTNVFMIEELQPQWEKGILSQDAQMDLGWCYFQNIKFEEALAVLDSFSPDADHLLDYHNLKGRVYLSMEKNEEALAHLVPWLAEIQKIKPDGTKKTDRKLARLGYAYYTIGSARAAIQLQQKEIEEKAFAETMEYFAKAIETEKEENQVVSYYHTVADIWRQRKEYNHVVEVCDRILALNQGYYPAVLLRQDACLQLGMYQEVMDDYQRAVHMYPYYGKPYATLVKMYFLFGEYDKVQQILQTAKEYKIESDALQILTARYRAVTAKRKEDLEEALRILDTLKEKGWSYSSDVEQDEWGEIAYRRGLILSDLGRLNEAKKALGESMADGKEDVSKIFAYATVLMQEKEYGSAVTYLKKALQYVPDDDGILYRIGWCYKLMGQYVEALSFMKQVLSINPEHPRVRQIIAELYERLARREEDNSYYQMALPYMKEQVEKYPQEYDLLEMGLLYLDMDEYEKALEYFEKAKEKNPESVYAYNNAGNCYLSMNEPEKAEPLFLEAIRFMKNEMTPLPYNNLAKCYRMMGQYEAALICYEKNKTLFPENLEIFLLLADFYRENEEYNKAIATYEEGIYRAREPLPLEMELLRTYGMKGDFAMVHCFFQSLIEKYPEEAVLYQLAGEIYLYGFSRGEEAIVYVKEALCLGKKEENQECIRGSFYLLGRCNLFLGKKEEAEKCFRKYLHLCRGEDESSRKYEEFYGERGRRKFRLGFVYLFLQRISEAEQCFQEMNTDHYRCDGCARSCCYEKLLGEAMMLLVKGKRELAMEKNKEVADKISDDMEYRFESMCLQSLWFTTKKDEE